MRVKINPHESAIPSYALLCVCQSLMVLVALVAAGRLPKIARCQLIKLSTKEPAQQAPPVCVNN